MHAHTPRQQNQTEATQLVIEDCSIGCSTSHWYWWSIWFSDSTGTPDNAWLWSWLFESAQVSAPPLQCVHVCVVKLGPVCMPDRIIAASSAIVIGSIE